MEKTKRKNWIVAGLLVFVLMFGAMFGLAGCDSAPAHEHTWSTDWTTDAANHWHACADCDETKDLAAHMFDDDHDTTCNTCGYVREVGNHAAETDWTSDETGHWHACTLDGCELKFDYAAHTPDEHGFCEVCEGYAGSQLATFPKSHVELGTLEAGTHYFRTVTNMPGRFTVTATNLPIESIKVYALNHYSGWQQIFDGTSFYFSYYSDQVDDVHIYFVITLENQIADSYINLQLEINA